MEPREPRQMCRLSRKGSPVTPAHLELKKPIECRVIPEYGVVMSPWLTGFPNHGEGSRLLTVLGKSAPLSLGTRMHGGVLRIVGAYLLPSPICVGIRAPMLHKPDFADAKVG